MKKRMLFLLLGLGSFFINAQDGAGDTTITTYSSVRGVTVTGEWKDGYVILKDDTVKKGQVKAWRHSGNDLKSVNFRIEKGAEKETYNADNCKLVNWGGTNILSWPKNFKKPQKGNRFYTAVYYGKNISVLIDPEEQPASGNYLNSGEYLKVLVIKDGNVTEIKKINFRKKMLALCKDNKAWHKKASNKANKKWFKYSNMFDVVKDYDTTK